MIGRNETLRNMSQLSQQCRSKAEKDGYTSLMNNTKWRELCSAFAGFERKPAWRTRDFLNSYLSNWDCEWFHHVGPDYCSIEWIEIDANDCSRESIRKVLESIGTQFEESEYFRVFGYKK